MKKLSISFFLIATLNLETILACDAGTRCITLPQALTALTETQARELRTEIAALGVENGFQRYCKPTENLDVFELGMEKICQSSSTNSVKRVCAFRGSLACEYKGFSFPVSVFGSCLGGPHDCGTFGSCASDKSIQVTYRVFRSENDMVPKAVDRKGER